MHIHHILFADIVKSPIRPALGVVFRLLLEIGSAKVPCLLQISNILDQRVGLYACKLWRICAECSLTWLLGYFLLGDSGIGNGLASKLPGGNEKI